MASLVNALTLDSMVTPLWFKIPFVGRYQVFYPEQRNGLLFHAGLILLLAAASLWGLNQATRTQIGPAFLLYLLPALMALALLPLAVYRAFALLRAYYIVERDGIRLHWGLRVEDIPMSEVLWIKGAKEAGMTLPLPWLHLPGAILGLRKLSNGTPVEYLAADRQNLVLIATTERIYAISPARAVAFLEAARRFAELGSPTPIPRRSVYPTFLWMQIWATPPARYLIVAGLFASLVLLVVVSLSVPSRAAISMGFRPDGSPRDLVPSIQLVLLPLVNAFFFLGNLLLGMFFFRRGLQGSQVESPSPSVLREIQTSRVLAYTLWGTAVLTPLILLVAVYFILRMT